MTMPSHLALLINEIIAPSIEAPAVVHIEPTPMTNELKSAIWRAFLAPNSEVAVVVPESLADATMAVFVAERMPAEWCIVRHNNRTLWVRDTTDDGSEPHILDVVPYPTLPGFSARTVFVLWERQ